MALSGKDNHKAVVSHHQAKTHMATAGLRLSMGRRKILLRRKRQLNTVHLGGKYPGFLVRVVRKMRLRWLKLQYVRMLKRLKGYYSKLLEGVAEAGAGLEIIQKRVIMESAFGVPVLGVSFSTFPSVAGPDRARYS